VEVYSQDTAYKEPHFSAIFIISSVIPASNNVIPAKGPHAGHSQELAGIQNNIIDIDPQTDLYGPILFQGKSFQCIEKIHELYYDEKTKKGECVFTSAYNKSAEEFLKKNKKFNKRFLIGDPYFIDSMLQSMQLIIPQDLSLPRKIERIDINMLGFQGQAKMNIGKSHIHKISNEKGIGNSSIFRDDKSIIRIRNCDLKILQTVLNRPSANDLVNPRFRDQKIIEHKLKELSSEYDFVIPTVRCLYDKRLLEANKELRHKIETPIIEEAVNAVLKHCNKLEHRFEIKWLKTGELNVVGQGIGDIEVSISHDGAFLLIVAENGIHGCDVEGIRKRSSKEWLNLLGKNKFDFLKKLSGDIDQLGTSIWCTVESISKFRKHNIFDLKVLIQGQDYVVFKSNILNKGYYVITFLIKLTLGISKIVALIVKGNGKSQPQSLNNEDQKTQGMIEKLGYKQEMFSVAVDDRGPQGQLVYIQKFPVTFKANQSLSRRVYFTNYFSWLGEIREHGIHPVMDELSKLDETGGWGVSTNAVKTQIMGELRGNDIVEVRFWLEKVSGRSNATFDGVFEWRKVLSEGRYERVAISKLRSTWIQITGHGEAKIAPLPDATNHFMNMMLPKFDKTQPLRNLPELLKDLQLGKKVLSLSIEDQRKCLLHQEVFQTTLEDSNLIGNIYFANYSKWLGRTVDLFFYDLIPEVFKGTGDKGELLCLNCEIEHLREAMPFDKVIVKMYLDTLYESGLDLYFEYYRLNIDSSETKLAIARFKAIWVKRKNNSIPETEMLPSPVISAIEDLKLCL
jgi:acyl-CoA thioesterase FadM